MLEKNAHQRDHDAIIVGAGPNGLAAAITLARAGQSVLVLEAGGTPGGGSRSDELTLPGFVHDVCSAIHPLGVASPFFRQLPLHDFRLRWIHSPAELAHPFDDGTAALVRRSVDDTADALGLDAAAYRQLMQPLVRDWQTIVNELLGPLRLPTRRTLAPRHALTLLRFGLRAIRPARALALSQFSGERARAVFAGMAAHSVMPLEWPATAAFALVLGVLAHTVGWPLAQGGSQAIADAMVAYLRTLGGEVVTGIAVRRLDELPSARAVLLDVNPAQVVTMAGERLPVGYRRALQQYRHGPGVFKLDIALDGPIPWRAAACLQAGTVHVGGTLAEIAAAERAVWRGEHPQRPFVLLAQQSLFDPSRAPHGRHTVWAYCHVPHGSTQDMTERIEAQIERFAPGFRARILARHARTAAEMAQYNLNNVGGDITGGVQDLRQLFTRPVARRSPYTTPVKRMYLCSASTPPGGGVHGLCGYHAAQAALRAMTAR